MTNFDIHAAVAILRETMPRFEQPLIEAMGAAHQTPFHILIATILSLRTKDTLTSVIAPRLFAAADTPAAMLALRAQLPAEYWIPINGLLVTLGQNICHPTSPRCSSCPVAALCRRVGVTRSR